MSQYLDVVGIIDALLNVTKIRCAEIPKINPTNGAWAISDCRTVGIYVGRQCGASEGSLLWMNKHPNECIHITKDLSIRDNLEKKYKTLTGKNQVDYIQLVPRISGTLDGWTEKLSEEQKASTKYIVVDDALFTVTSGPIKRKDFNHWVYETFGDKVYVILIK